MLAVQKEFEAIVVIQYILILIIDQKAIRYSDDFALITLVSARTRILTFFVNSLAFHIYREKVVFSAVEQKGIDTHLSDSNLAVQRVLSFYFIKNKALNSWNVSPTRFSYAATIVFLETITHFFRPYCIQLCVSFYLLFGCYGLK